MTTATRVPAPTDDHQNWPVPAPMWSPDEKTTIALRITEDEAIRRWAELLRDYIVQSIVGPLRFLPLDEVRRDVFKNARPLPCPTALRDRAQLYCALHFRDEVLCDGVNWYRLTVQVS